MLLHQLKPKNARDRKKPRIGRGGKRGYSSGRGQKGQGSRAGHRIRPAERDFIIRLPKLRGYKNKIITPINAVVKIGVLETLKDVQVTPETLKAAKILKNTNSPIKILDGGVIKRAFMIDKKIKMSSGAKAKILAAGGKVIE